MYVMTALTQICSILFGTGVWSLTFLDMTQSGCVCKTVVILHSVAYINSSKGNIGFVQKTCGHIWVVTAKYSCIFDFWA